MAEDASTWVVRWAGLAPRGPALDVACGGGRHARLLASLGFDVHAVDREPQDLPGVRFLQADLEAGAPWPYAGRAFAAVVVTNYLHRPLFPALAASVAPGGLLVYETFMDGNQKYGRPSNPAFLLRPGELLAAFPGLAVVAFEQGFVERPKLAVVQRLCAVRGPIESARIAP